MESFEVAKMGERGQVVIPLEFRKSMGLQPGEKFIVTGREDFLILKKMKAPTIDEFEKMLRSAHEHARKHGLTETDLEEAIKTARRKK